MGQSIEVRLNGERRVCTVQMALDHARERFRTLVTGLADLRAHQLELGRVLLSLYDAYVAKRGSWSGWRAWLSDNVPEIHAKTAQRCRKRAMEADGRKLDSSFGTAHEPYARPSGSAAARTIVAAGQVIASGGDGAGLHRVIRTDGDVTVNTKTGEVTASGEIARGAAGLSEDDLFDADEDGDDMHFEMGGEGAGGEVGDADLAAVAPVRRVSEQRGGDAGQHRDGDAGALAEGTPLGVRAAGDARGAADRGVPAGVDVARQLTFGLTYKVVSGLRELGRRVDAHVITRVEADGIEAELVEVLDRHGLCGEGDGEKTPGGSPVPRRAG